MNRRVTRIYSGMKRVENTQTQAQLVSTKNTSYNQPIATQLFKLICQAAQHIRITHVCVTQIADSELYAKS